MTNTVKPLNPRQERFAKACVHLQDPMAAALEAGYAHSTAARTAHRLLRDQRVDQRIKSLQQNCGQEEPVFAATARSQEKDTRCPPLRAGAGHAMHASQEQLDDRAASEQMLFPELLVKDAQSLSPQMLCQGLFQEATYYGRGASHSARVRAWECLARLRATQLQEQETANPNAKTVVFDIVIDGQQMSPGEKS